MSRFSSVVCLVVFLGGCGFFAPNDTESDRDTDSPSVDTDLPVDTDSDIETSDDVVAVCLVDFAALELGYGEATLSGRDSYDPLGHSIATFDWTLVSKPAASEAVLEPLGLARAARKLVPDVVGMYTARLVVTTDDGRTSAPCDVVVEAVVSDQLRIELTWETALDDLDLHLLESPESGFQTGEDCYYGNVPLDWGAPGLEGDCYLTDDVQGTGPEVIRLASGTGVYAVVIHDYPASVVEGDNLATVQFTVDGVIVDTLQVTVTGEDSRTYVATVELPSGVVTPCEPTGCAESD